MRSSGDGARDQMFRTTTRTIANEDIVCRWAGRLLPMVGAISFVADCSVPAPGARRGELVGSVSQRLVTDDNIHGLPAGIVALTYDDGPDTYSLQLASYLKRQKISATFFVVGDWLPTPAEYHPGPQGIRNIPIGHELIELGHRVGNHADHHSYVEGLPSEFFNLQPLIDPLVTNELYLLRSPGGQWSPTLAGQIRANSSFDKVTGPIYWDVFGNGIYDDLSCVTGSQTPAACAQYYVQGVQAQGGGIILMHDRNVQAVGTDYALRLTRELVSLLKAQSFVFAAPVLRFANRHPGTQFSDQTVFGTDNSGYYGTIRVADVNGDGKADVCGRASTGIQCAVSTGVDFAGATEWLTTDMTDAEWLPAKYSTTIQLADVNGDGRADVCGRGSAGIVCGLSKTDGHFWSPVHWSDDFSDATVFDDDVGYYGTIRLGDVNGDGAADVCGRGPEGILCGLSDGGSFATATQWLGTDMADANGWLPAKYSTTIQLGDVDGDGRADVCGRGSAGVVCGLAKTDGSGFLQPTNWTSEFADWTVFDDDVSYYGTLRLADLNGDGRADLCLRGPDGVRCGLSNGSGFVGFVTWLGNDMTDSQGWQPLKYGTTMQLGDINGDGRADVCGRGSAGVGCGFAP